jgi:asparagine synthase (glutamine-hydrolysing)
VVYEEGRFWVVQNGEIYKYLELREELEKLDHRFATSCNTEVLAKAYAEFVEDEGPLAFTLQQHRTVS